MSVTKIQPNCNCGSNNKYTQTISNPFPVIDEISELLCPTKSKKTAVDYSLSNTKSLETADTKDLINQIMNLLSSLFGNGSKTYNKPVAQEGTKTTENQNTTSSKGVNSQTYNKNVATTVNNYAGDGDKIINNAYEKEYDGSADKKLKKTEATVKVKQDDGSSSAMTGFMNAQFNTYINGNHNNVNVQNNYHGANAKGTDANVKTETKIQTSSDFISNKSTKDGITSYLLSNGMKVDLPEGTAIGDDSFYIDPKTGEASFSGLKGAKITGTKKVDLITLYDCESTEVDAGDGSDKVEAYNSKDITLKGGIGRDLIKTVSCKNVVNDGGIGKDKIWNINCSGVINNDGGSGRDEIKNDVYGVKNNTASSSTASTSASTTAAATTSTSAAATTSASTTAAQTTSNVKVPAWLEQLQAMFNVIINGQYNNANVQNNYRN